MKPTRTLCALALAVLVASAAAADEQPPVKKGTPLDANFLRLYAETRGFMLGRPVKAKPTPDGKAVLFLRAEAKVPKLKLYEFEVATGKTKELLTPEQVLKGAEEHLSAEEKARRERMRVSVGGFADFQLTEDGRLILLSLSGKLYVYDRAKGSVRELKAGPGVIDPKFSPDGKMVGYVREQDVYVYDLAADRELAVTTGGTPKKTHGLAEFVAQEEMARFSGYWWSPDSRLIAYEEADHEGVEVWYVADASRPGQPPSAQYYPRPGKKNVSVRVGIVPVPSGSPDGKKPEPTVWVDWDRGKYEYLAQVRWDKHGPTTITVQDRKQQEQVLLRVDPATGRTTTLLTERDPAWVNIHQSVPAWLPGGERFLYVLVRNGREDLFVCNVNGSEPIRIAPAPGEQATDYVFAGLEGIDRDRLEVYYRVYGDIGADRIYSVRLKPDGRPDKYRDVAGRPAGLHSATFSKDFSVGVFSETTLTEMPKSIVRPTAKFQVLGELPSVAIEPGFKPNITVQKVGEGAGFYTAIVRPQNFDPTKKYPVIVDVYGGPHHLTVVQAMRPWLLMQWLADQGFIVVGIDNRGTPGRGRDWERAVYRKFGTVPLEDQVAGLRALGKKYPEMDLDRVGIVGWSFGGYMAAQAVLKRPDVYKAAVAGAPVTDWEDYDTHYTERYMGLLPESKEAYAEGSLLPLAPKLERPLLLVHGTADDNVYFRHTLRLTDALFRAGKDFEVLPLPSLTHMVPDPVVTERLWTRIAGHFRKHLGGPKER